MNRDQKIESWAEREILRNLPNMIVKDEDTNGWVAFGKYQIVPDTVGYKVFSWTSEIHTFASKRAAISYCIADNCNKINLAHQILTLDTRQQLLYNDINCRKIQCARTRKQDFYDTVDAKVQPTIIKYNAVTSELEKCVNRAKYIQIRGFHNETARIHGH
jgi:hypothetical protein